MSSAHCRPITSKTLLLTMTLISISSHSQASGYSRRRQDGLEKSADAGNVQNFANSVYDDDDGEIKAEDIISSILHHQPFSFDRHAQLNVIDRKKKWTPASLCGGWDDWCVPGSDKVALRCCSGYACRCNLLWNSNCRCRSKLFGR